MHQTSARVDQDIVEFFRLGYGKNVSFNFMAPINTPETFVAAADVAGRYNLFCGAETAESFVAEFWDETMGVEFGRSASPALEVALPFWTNQRHDAGAVGEPIAEAERKALAVRIMEWGVVHRADAVSVFDMGGNRHSLTLGKNPAAVVSGLEKVVTVRLWWG